MMKNKKRFSAFFLAAALTVSLSACGTSDNTENEQAVSQTTNTEESQETAEENIASEETENVGTTSGSNILISKQ